MAVKAALIKSLKTILHECIIKQEQSVEQLLTDNEITSLLCSSIEAIYLHGKIEETSLLKISRFLQGKNKNQNFQHCHFWDAIHEFVPPHMKEFMSHSVSCKTPVGCCRVWIRASLNEGTLQNYLSSLAHDQQKIKKCYSEWAYLRDVELTETTLELLKSLETLRFDLNLTSHSLNDWHNSTALHLAGISSSSSTKVRIATTSSPALAQGRVSASSYNILHTSVPDNNLPILIDNGQVDTSRSPSSSVSGPRVDNETTLDEREVMSFISPDFDSLLQRSVRESRASSSASFQVSTVSESLPTSLLEGEKPTSQLQCSNQSFLSTSYVHEDMNYLEKSFMKQTETLLSLHGSLSSRSPPVNQSSIVNEEIDHPVSSSHQLLPQPSDSTALTLDRNSASFSPTELPPGSNSLAVHRSCNSWWSAPNEKPTNEEHSIENAKVIEPQEESTVVEALQGHPVIEVTNEASLASTETASYNDIWSTALPNLIGTYQRMAQEPPLAAPSGYQEERTSTIVAEQNPSDVANVPPTLMSHEKQLIRPIVEGNRSSPYPPSQDSENASDWQFLGDDFMDRLPAERSRLLNVYPGVERFSHPCGVYGGKCTICDTTLNPKNWVLDYYDGRLYCVGCNMQEKCIIPRDVINNWDFTQKPVSQFTKTFLMDMVSHPNINLLHRNSNLYRVVPALKRICHLRQQLSLLWYQITICDEVAAYQLRIHLGSRDYMLSSLQEVHLYSLEDLQMIKNGTLEKLISSAINTIAVPHVTTCSECRQRSVQCELCYQSDKPIYLYELGTYIQCSTPSCSRVIHRSCVKTLGVNAAYVMCQVCRNYLQDGLCPTTSIGGYDEPSPLGGSMQSIDCIESA